MSTSKPINRFDKIRKLKTKGKEIRKATPIQDFFPDLLGNSSASFIDSITFQVALDKLSIFIKQTDGEETVLTATQTGEKKEFSFKQLLINFFKYPLMTIKIISSIHYEAFFLWKKGAVYRKRENKVLNNLSYEEY